ncbi:MAG: TadE/TadG family type IV pilus assembly protein [Candidatus Limnocylindria bacterium]
MRPATPRRAHRDERGQSLVEIALAVPLLLLILVGIADVGRLYFYANAVTNAAREAAFYAARDPEATGPRIEQRACREMGFAECPSELRVTSTRVCLACPGGTAAGSDVRVRATYEVSLMVGYLVGRGFDIRVVPVSAEATAPGLAE